MTLSEDPNQRMAFFEAFASTEYFLALRQEARDDALNPLTFQTSDGTFALAFRDEAGLSEFTQGSEFAALPGRVLASVLAPQSIGLCLDAHDDPTLLPPDALAWLVDLLAVRPAPVLTKIDVLEPLTTVAPDLVRAFQIRANAAPGMASTMVLAQGPAGPICAILDAQLGADAALEGAIQEALVFANVQSPWAIAFLPSNHPSLSDLGDFPFRIEFPKMAPPERLKRLAPGTDPQKPPILR